MKRTIIISLLCLLCGGAMQAQKIRIKTGIEVLKEQNFRCLEGKRVGLITNPTGVDNRMRSTIDILHEAPNVNLVALYGPEHGVRGDVHAGDHVTDIKDATTGLPVYSLYGKTRKATPDMLKDVDVLVYDIQDIGCRSFTYISTMGLAMEAAAENGKEFIVLDRPNPVGGLKIEGNLVEDDCTSFVSQFKIPYLYALTCGELALMLNGEKMLKDGEQCNLHIVKMKGWKRKMDYTQTGLQWVPSSPHIPHPHSAFFYPVSGILGELGYMSIGVGYTIPFQMFAAGIIGLALGDLDIPLFAQSIYNGFTGMNEVFFLSLFCGGMSEMIAHNGGITWLIEKLGRMMKGNKSAQVGVAALVSLADCATANNTVAIIVSGPMAKNMSRIHKVDPRRTASLLDVFSCVLQGMIPWGAQLLTAASLTTIYGVTMNPIDILPYMWYCWILAAVGILSIFIPFADGICRKDPWNWEYDVAESGVAAKKASLELERQESAQTPI